MRKLIWAVLFLLCLSLQMSLPQNQWFKFDLPLLLIYCLAMLKGAFAGGIAGFFVGLLQDLLTGSSFTYYIFNFAVSRVGARFCCVFTRRQRGKKSWQINAQSYKPY